MKEAGSVLLSGTLLREAGLNNGDTLTIVSPRGRQDLTIRGSFENQRFGRIFQGSVGIMDLLPAQMTFGKEGRFDWIDIALSPGADEARVRELVASRVSGLGEVVSPATRGKRVEAMLAL